MAQLVSAEKAKGDPKGEAQKKLLKAAKLVTQAIEEVVRNANECKHHSHFSEDLKVHKMKKRQINFPRGFDLKRN